MMKATYAIAALGASALAVPTFAPQGGEESLQVALQRTVHTLEQLADLEQRFTAAPRAVLPEVVAATEAPLPPGPERDERLNALRADLGRLQTELDLAERALPDTAGAAAGGHEHRYAQGRDAGPGGVATTGLAEGELQALAKARPTAAREPVAQTAPERVSLEPEGFSADVVGEGRALVRAGRFEEALERLADAPTDEAAATYWTGRALEKLGRIDEALEAYGKVVVLDPESFEGKRAQEDIEFLEWKRSFEKRAQSSGGGR